MNETERLFSTIFRRLSLFAAICLCTFSWVSFHWKSTKDNMQKRSMWQKNGKLFKITITKSMLLASKLFFGTFSSINYNFVSFLVARAHSFERFVCTNMQNNNNQNYFFFSLYFAPSNQTEFFLNDSCDIFVVC